MNKIMYKIFIFFIAFAVFFSTQKITVAKAAPVVADLSNYRIAMDAGFNGTRLFLFGARNDNGDIIVIIRGENKNYIVRKKEKIAGMWINRSKMKFHNIPNFYSIASSRPLSEMLQTPLFVKLGIGETNLLPQSGTIREEAQLNEFEKALLKNMRKSDLYTTKPENISFMGETLFKTVIEFSDNIPPGNYTAEIYLISDGEVVGMQSTPISVVKSGTDAFIYNFAHNSPFLYGLSAVVIAISAGWLAGRLLEVKA